MSSGEGRADSQSEDENASQLVDMISESAERYRDILRSVLLSAGSLVREPPPAYIPAGRLPLDDIMRWVGVGADFGAFHAERVPQVGGEVELPAS